MTCMTAVILKLRILAFPQRTILFEQKRNRLEITMNIHKSSNIGKTTTRNQCRRVPDLWRPGPVKIKRYYTKNGRLIPTAKRGKEIKQP